MLNSSHEGDVLPHGSVKTLNTFLCMSLFYLSLVKNKTPFFILAKQIYVFLLF